MALWKDTPAPAAPTPVPAPVPAPTAAPAAAPVPAPQSHSIPKENPMSAVSPVSDSRRPSQGGEVKESLIAADVDIEGKIEGAGHVRIAGNFKGDINVQGNLTIEVGAKVTGQVRANQVHVAGELHGNVESASQVELLQSGVIVGDVKSGSLTVASGARMKGTVDFGWGDKASGGKASA